MPVQSSSIMHHYECVVLCKDISLQRGRFCVHQIFSLMYPKIQQREKILYHDHVLDKVLETTRYSI